MSAKIMIVEDDPAIQRSVRYFLESNGYTVVTVSTGEEALRIVTEEQPDLILLDIVLPGMSGLEVCQQIRKKIYIPIIMLTAKSEEIDKVLGLEMGADDYVTKPFGDRELLARIRAQLRRATVYDTPQETGRVIQVGPLRIDEAAREVTVNEQPVDLTPKEYDLLYVLAANAGRVLERETLLDKVWGESVYLDSRTLDVHVRRLRLKIEADPSQPNLLVTVPGVGYKMTAAPRAL